MSMEIHGSCGQYQTDYAEKLKEQQEKLKGTDKTQESKNASQKVPALQDEYVNSEKSGAKPSGLYRVGQDEEGKKKIFFDDPKKSDNAGRDGQPKVRSDEPEKCVGNTDKVEREIRALKEKKKQLEQQISSAAGEEKKVEELEKELAQVERELGQKDNDTYRRQHTSFSEQ